MSTVLVVRPRPEADALADRLRDMGHEPVVSPLMSVRATGAVAPDGPFDAALVSSARTVGYIESAPPDPLFAVGERTAAALRARGFAVAGVHRDGAAWVAHMRDRPDPPRRVLHPRGRHVAGDWGAMLTASELVPWVVYDTPARPLDAHVLDAIARGKIDAVLVTSPRLGALLGDACRAAGLAVPPVHAISEAAARAVACDAPARIAERPDLDALLATLPPA